MTIIRSHLGFTTIESMYKCCIRVGLLLIFTFFVCAIAYCQSSEKVIEFNTESKSQVGIGLAITSFSSNFTYFVSPHYAYRYHQHWFGITPFYGRLDALATQQDIGLGLDYRLYPFKNLNTTMLYFPIGVHYNYKWKKRSQNQYLVYKVGFGLEAFLGKGFSLSLDANFGIGHTLTSKTDAGETATFGSDNDINYYFIPVFRLSHQL